jgi:uncharacterized protein YwgA
MSNNLKSIIKTLEDEGIFHFNINDFDSRLRLQKYIFIAKAFEVSIPYQYSMYVHGPYSPSLAHDYYRLDQVNSNDYFDLPEDFLDLVADKDERWLELAATMIMLNEDSSSEEDLVSRVMEIKGSSQDETVEIADELENYGLI